LTQIAPSEIRANILARAFLTLGALLPYWRLLTFGVIYVTDDYFASDILNGELAGRVLVGQMVRHGQAPVWTNQLCSGLPLAGSAVDPIGLGVFSLLPTAAALDLFVIVLLLVAAHGAYSLARRFGADRTAAILAGVAFAGSGYIACQLKHLAIVATVVWLPVGLVALDRALGDEAISRARRALLLATFGLVFAQQVLSGFPQSSYICALVYGSFALFRALVDRRRFRSLPAWLPVLSGVGVATALGAAAGAVVLLPLFELGKVSDRAEALGWVWSTYLAYWPPNVLTFLAPYIHGDISNNTYVGPPFFWEDYGYVGAATFLLAIYGAVRERRRPMVAFAILMTLVAYLFVLGQATPVFRIAYLVVPGMKMFRFPTRFLIVVELGLALLGAVGLTRLRADLVSTRVGCAFRGKAPSLIAAAICAGTALDLFVHQPRQNPMVPGRDWLAAPAAVTTIRADTTEPRTFTPRHRDLHRRSFQLAQGWSKLQPYFELRDVLAPNTGGGFWKTPSADCYAGIAATWYVNLWGDHNREESLVSLLTHYDYERRTLRIHPRLPNILRTYGVTHLLSPFPQQEPALTLVSRDGMAYVYRVDGEARVRFVRAARHVAADGDAARRLLATDFDPDREILLHDAPDSIDPSAGEREGSSSTGPGRAVVTREDNRHIIIDAEAPEDGFLLLADTFYPGWTAQIDGNPTPVYRANISVRGIRLPKGRHEVRFTYDAPGFVRGLWITLLAVAALMMWAGAAAYMDCRVRR
jgi:hypothetical protein